MYFRDGVGVHCTSSLSEHGKLLTLFNLFQFSMEHEDRRCGQIKMRHKQDRGQTVCHRLDLTGYEIQT